MKVITVTAGVCATNSYILINNGRAVVIDPTDEPESIAERIENENALITHVLLTHGHYDHVGGTARIGGKVVMSKADHDVINALNDKIFDTRIEPFVVDKFPSDGEKLIINDIEFKVIFTPGHTPGSVCYIADGMIFSGDTLFALSVGRTDLPLGNAAELKASLKNLLALDGDYIVYPGHGASTTLDRERRYNPYV